MLEIKDLCKQAIRNRPQVKVGRLPLTEDIASVAAGARWRRSLAGSTASTQWPVSFFVKLHAEFACLSSLTNRAFFAANRHAQSRVDWTTFVAD
jgi:hypothetical protein